MTTSPGFSSRSTTARFTQFPQRDEAAMTDAPGFSNSAHAAHAPDDVHPDVAVPDELEPGFTNGKAVTTGAESKVVTTASTEDKSAKKTTTRKRS